MTRAAIALALIAAAGLTACEALRDYHANNPDWGSNVPPYERIQFAGHPVQCGIDGRLIVDDVGAGHGGQKLLFIHR